MSTYQSCEPPVTVWAGYNCRIICLFTFCVEIPRARHLSYLGFSVAASGYQVSRAQTPTLWLELPHLTLADGPGWVRGCTGPMGAPTQRQLSRVGPSLASNFCSELEPVLKWTWARWLV